MDMPVHDLLGVGAGGEPGPDELRAIVSRAGRRRLRFAAGGMAVALAVGGVVGYAVSNHSAASTQTASASAPTASSSNSDVPAASGAAAAGGFGQNFSSGSVSTGESGVASRPYTHLFNRTAGTVTIRGFLTNFPEPAGLAASCGFPGLPQFEAEVSTAQMVGTSDSFGAQPDAANPVSAAQTDLFGTAEGDPVAVVTAATGSTVTEVRMAFAGGATDEMVPVKGWVALAAPVSAKLSDGQTLGTLTALNAAGKTLSSTPLTLGQFAPVTPATPACTGNCTVRAAPLQTTPVNGAAGAVAASPPGASASCSVCSSSGSGSTTIKGQPAFNPTTRIDPGGPMIPATGNASSSSAAYACARTAPLKSLVLPPAPAISPPAAAGGSISSGGSTGSAGSSSSAG
jgi:hypothetical protein